MKEVHSGPHRSSEGQSLPADARLIAQTDAYRVFVSREAGSVIMVTSDYHPGTLQLGPRDLELFARELQKVLA